MAPRTRRAPQREWDDAVADAKAAAEEIRATLDEVLEAAQTRAAELRAAAEEEIAAILRRAHDETEAPRERLEEALETLRGLREACQERYDGLSERAQESERGQALLAVAELDCDVALAIEEPAVAEPRRGSAIEPALESNLDEIEALLDEAEQAELPKR